MLRLPAVAGRFYPSDPSELTSLIRNYTQPESQQPPASAKACLVPHAGYMYSGHVAGAVFARLALPKKIIVLGVRHYPRGEPAAILSAGAWRTPLGDAPIDEGLAGALRHECPLLREDSVAHSTEHSLEVQMPFLQALASGFSFVPVALGNVQFESLVSVGEGIARVLENSKDSVLLLTTSDLNHYEDDATTRVKDHKAIDRLLALDAHGLYDICRNEEISMCGLGPAVAMLTALNALGAKKAELVKYATSADISGDRSQVVGYAGMIFSKHAKGQPV
ncbi:MAG TPA: AmmeMemoRadiSam system protein B [Candidatus Acidoferrum sp.]|nr:AmmeMemoRadiSam system protein B [Candidatus Acidoferrum sp.]